MIASATLRRVQSYIDDVLSGEVVAGKLVRAAVQRHVDDLAKESTQEFPYHFDTVAAEVAIDYFQDMLCHSIGDYAGQPFILEPWQAFGTAMIFGWKRDVDATRRFRRVYWSQGRKNGKSTFSGGLALQLASLDFNPKTGNIEQVAEVILCATKREQVEKVMFAEILRMRHQSPALKAQCTAINKQVTFKHNTGSIRCVGSDRPYDGLNPLGVFKDELHEFQEYHRKFLNTMDTGGGSRSQPLEIITTTAGDTSSTVWIEVYNYCKGVVTGEIKDEAIFTYCFEMDEKDDVLDEANWPKSNPNLGVSVKASYLRDQATKARNSAVELNTFKRYHANQLVSSLAKAFSMDEWDACEGTLSDWADADAIGGGIDLGGRDDLAAWGLVARFKTGEQITVNGRAEEVYRYEGKIGAYIWEETRRNLAHQPFAGWVYDGILVVAKHPTIQLQADMVNACLENGVDSVAYDPSGGIHIGESMDQAGIDIHPMGQTTTHFHEPITDLMQSIREKRFTHNGDPLLRWCASNAVITSNPQMKRMFDKRNSEEKIDGIVALTMAYRRAMVAVGRATGDYFVTG